MTFFVYTKKFTLEFGPAAYSLVSCETNKCGLCNSNETQPALRKYIRNDQYILDNTCKSCADGWSFFDSWCFKTSDTDLTYEEAKSDCQSNNSYLAILNSDAKFDFVKSLIKDKSYFVITYP